MLPRSSLSYREIPGEWGLSVAGKGFEEDFMPNIIVGTGDHVYKAVHPFGKLPSGIETDNISHVATDSLDRVYLYHRKNPPVLVLDGEGNFLSSWGESQLIDAHGIYITHSDDIFLVDRDAHEVLKFNTQGQIQLRMGVREKPSLQAPFNHPANVAIAPSGEIFVADGYANSAVHRFTSEGKLIKSWGAWGTGPGQFITPHGIWADGHDRVYICDRDNNRVQVFDVDGKYMSEWTGFFHPMDIFMDANETFYVTDQVPGMTLLNSRGEMVTRIRTLFSGHGMWVDSKGNMYTVGNNDAVTKYVKQ